MTNDLKRLRSILGRIDVPQIVGVVLVEDPDHNSLDRAVELDEQVQRHLEEIFDKMGDSFVAEINKKRRKKK